MMRVPPRRGGQGVVVKSTPQTFTQRTVNGSSGTFTTKPVPNATIQSQPKYQ